MSTVTRYEWNKYQEQRNEGRSGRMINIWKDTQKYGCFCHNEYREAYAIRAINNEHNGFQTIYLCEDCMKELKNKLNEFMSLQEGDKDENSN